MLRFALLLTLLAGGELARAASPSLMPLPVTMDAASGKLAIDRNFTVNAAGCSDPRLAGALARFLARLSRQTGIPGWNRPAAGAVPSLAIACAAAGPPYPALEEDESYQLDTRPSPALLQAATIAGVLHGLETFLQLVQPGADGFQVPAVHIQDRPRFPWRGLMLDVSRHWMPLAVVERNLDAMAAVKLNVFHWHLSDDQGFRAESKLFPRLQQLGSDGNFYTQDEIRRVVAYARDRGVRVVPEFDIPGHTTSWFLGYPELASAPGPYEIGRHFGVFDAAMDPSREETYTFLDAFIGEMAQLFPDPYFHIGGDEVNGKQWNQSARVQAFAREHGLDGTLAIQTYFNQRIQKILLQHGKIMIGWDEVLGPDLPPGTVIQSWRGQESLADAAAKGYRGILSSGYYLDHLKPARYHYGMDPQGGPAAGLDAAQAARILGGEACMWGELIDAETVDSRIWPRAAAIAERLWSPRDVADADDMYARLEVASRLLEWTGVQHRAVSGPMLDSLAGNHPAEALRVLADACEALGLGNGRRGSRYTTETPLNRFVDALPPESESVRALERVAARIVASRVPDPLDAAQLRRQFDQWAGNDARFQPAAAENALLAELKPLSKDLAMLGATGLRALGDLESGHAAPEEWIAGQTRECARMERPAAEVSLAAVRPVKLLLEELARRSRKAAQ